MDEPLDLRSLKCPLPAMLARKALARLGAGRSLIVLADDPMALVDIPHMCHGEGHVVEGVTRHAAYAEFRIRAGAAVRPEGEAAAAAEAGPDDPVAPRQDPDGGSPRRR